MLKGALCLASVWVLASGRSAGFVLDDSASCPQEIGWFSHYRCKEFVTALEAKHGNLTETPTVTVSWAPTCLYYETKCHVVHPTEGEQILVDKFDFDSEKCDRKLLYEYDYNVTVNGDRQELRTYDPVEISTGEQVLIPNLKKILMENDEPTQTLRVQLRDGINDSGNMTQKGFFFRAEIASLNTATNKYQNDFVNFMYIKDTYVSNLCPQGVVSIGATYSVYSDSVCTQFLREVRYFEADGICTKTGIRSSDGTVSYEYATSLCDGDFFYAVTPTTASQCLARAESTLDLKANADFTIKISTQRGYCVPYDGVYFTVSEGACKPNEDVCTWREGKYEGTFVFLDTNVTQATCLRLAVQSQQYGSFCAIGWDDAGGSVSGVSTCYGVSGSCSGPYGSRTGDWGCLLKSTGGKTQQKSDTVTLIIFLVIICVLCPLLFLVLLIGMSRYLRRKWAKAHRDQPHTAIDSGRTTGVVTGVPVPAIRPLDHPDDEDRCSVAPFEPDPNVTTNPLKLLDGDEIVDGQLETQADSPSESPTYATNDRRPLHPQQNPPPHLEGDTVPIDHGEVSNVSTENIPF